MGVYQCKKLTSRLSNRCEYEIILLFVYSPTKVETSVFSRWFFQYGYFLSHWHGSHTYFATIDLENMQILLKKNIFCPFLQFWYRWKILKHAEILNIKIIWKFVKVTVCLKTLILFLNFLIYQKIKSSV